MSRNLIISYPSSMDSQFVKDDDAAICLGCSMRIPVGTSFHIRRRHARFSTACVIPSSGYDWAKICKDVWSKKKMSHLNITPHWLTSTFGFIWSWYVIVIVLKFPSFLLRTWTFRYMKVWPGTWIKKRSLIFSRVSTMGVRVRFICSGIRTAKMPESGPVSAVYSQTELTCFDSWLLVRIYRIIYVYAYYIYTHNYTHIMAHNFCVACFQERSISAGNTTWESEPYPHDG